MTTFGQFRDAIRYEFGIDCKADGSGSENAKADLWIQAGVERVLMDTGCYVTAESLTVSGLTAVTSLNGTVTDYLMPVEVLEIVGMYGVTSSWPNARLDRVPVPVLIEHRRMSLPTGTPTYEYALAGGPELPPSDLVEKRIWSGITLLPAVVA